MTPREVSKVEPREYASLSHLGLPQDAAVLLQRQNVSLFLEDLSSARVKGRLSLMMSMWELSLCGIKQDRRRLGSQTRVFSGEVSLCFLQQLAVANWTPIEHSARKAKAGGALGLIGGC